MFRKHIVNTKWNETSHNITETAQIYFNYYLQIMADSYYWFCFASLVS